MVGATLGFRVCMWIMNDAATVEKKQGKNVVCSTKKGTSTRFINTAKYNHKL